MLASLSPVLDDLITRYTWFAALDLAGDLATEKENELWHSLLLRRRTLA